MRRFAGVELDDDRILDETTIFNFRHLLERHGMTKAIFAEVSAHLADKGITLRSGNLVDATIIDEEQGPDMSTTRKGNDRYFGMKTHIGVDVESGMIHSIEATTAKVHDSRVWYELLQGDATSVAADKGYINAEREAEFRECHELCVSGLAHAGFRYGHALKRLDSAPGDGVRTPTFGQARVLIRTPQRAT